jgi:NADH-quinone oxidoreductase subunit N
VPFHQWFPDVAHGAPTPVSLYIGVAGLSAAVAVFVRLVLVVFGGSQPTRAYAVAAVALVTLVWGNLAALSQRNLKRLLAYATIANVGFLLFALVAANLTGLVAIAWSLFSNLFATAGIFAILLIVSGGKDNSAGEELDDLNGLYQRSPIAAILLLLFAASLAGFPPTAGFLAKYFLVQSLIESHHPVLAGLLALGILPFVYSAFRIVQHAWIKHPAPSAETAPPVITLAQTVALTIAAFVTLVAGCYPEPFTRLARYAFGQ